MLDQKMEDFEWNVSNEGLLLEALVGYKPIGISKHFQMLCIWEKLTEYLKKDIQPSKIWEHLKTLYDLEGLDDNEEIPFPNELKEFSLPDTDYQIFKIKKEEKIENEKKTQKSRETPKSIKEVKKEDGKRTPTRIVKEKEVARRDSRDKDGVKEIKTPVAKKEVKKEKEPVLESRSSKSSKSRSSVGAVKETSRAKREESPARPPKRPTRGSLKPDDSNGKTSLGSSGKASPLTVTPSNKRRRI